MTVSSCPGALPAHDVVLLGHGSGGKLSAQLLHDVFLAEMANPVLSRLEDQAVLDINGLRLAFTTDTFVVKPIFFPGGDIGSLAVHGTVNDLAMGGARPLALSAAFILEEGFSLSELRRVVHSLAHAAERIGVPIVTGDTKVVERGSGDGLFINTSGIGLVMPSLNLSCANAQPGDAVILSGAIGDHGICILSQREGLQLQSPVMSDSAPLHTLVQAVLSATSEVRCMRDPTRGGLASTLNEIAQQSKVGLRIEEPALTIHDEVRGACELLGLDPLYVANEGKLVAIVPVQTATAVLAAIRAHPLGSNAAIIGTVTQHDPGRVTMRTAFGSTRIVDLLPADQLPRIC